MSRLITWYIRIAWTWKNCQCLTIWLVPVPNYTIRCATSAFVTFYSELPVETEWIRCVAGDPKGLSLKLECWVLSTERLSAWCNVSGSWGWSVLIEYWGQCLTTVVSYDTSVVYLMSGLFVLHVAIMAEKKMFKYSISCIWLWNDRL